MNLQIEGISNNMRYLFTNKGVVSLTEELNDLNGKNVAQYTFENLNIAVDIMRENMEFDFLTKKIDIQEYAFASRKFLNMLMETFDPDNKITIIKEWEMKFGNGLMLINESMDDVLRKSRVDESWNAIRIIVEQWYNPLDWAKGAAGLVKKGVENVGKYAYDTAKSGVEFAKSQAQQLKQKGLTQYISDKASAVWNRVKENIIKAWNCVAKDPVECLMEGMRSIVMSSIGVGILTGINVAIPGLGNIPNAIIFGALGIWDAYKLITTGDYWKYGLNLLIDVVSGFAPAIAKGISLIFRGAKNFFALGAKMAMKGGVFKSALNIIAGLGSKLGQFFGAAATWLGDKLGLTFLKNFGARATEKATQMADDITKGAASVSGGRSTVIANVPGGGVATKAGTAVMAARSTPAGKFATKAISKGMNKKAAISAFKKSAAKKILKNKGKKLLANTTFRNKITQRMSLSSKLLTPQATKFFTSKKDFLKGFAKGFGFNTVFCAAMGVDDPIMCYHRAERMSDQEIKTVQLEEEKLYADAFQATMLENPEVLEEFLEPEEYEYIESGEADIEAVYADEYEEDDFEG